MKGLLIFIRNFFNNNGHYVFSAMLIAKMTGFLSALVAINMLLPKDYGLVSLVNSIFIIFLSFNGLGSHQILLRYGIIIKDEGFKDHLSTYLLRRGLQYEIIVLFLFSLSSLFYLREIQDVWMIFLFFMVRLIGSYFYLHIQSFLRVKGDNKSYSQVMNVVNIGGLLLVIAFSYLWGMYGYLMAMGISPFLSLWWFRKISFQNLSLKKIMTKKMWSYGLGTIFTAMTLDLLLVIDVLLLGYLTNEVAVANYRTALIIPANMVFLATTFIQSDYPTLVKNYRNKSFLLNYIKNYYKLFFLITIVIIILSYFGRYFILDFFFGSQYSNLEMLFMIGVLAYCISMLGKNLFINLIYVLGHVRLNTIASIITIISLVLFSFYLVPIYGIVGMAWSLCISVFLHGVILMLMFISKMKEMSS